MWPLAWSAVPSAGPAVGVVTVLVALLDAESDEQLATVSKLATASSETGKRNINWGLGEEKGGPAAPVPEATAASSGLPLLPEHEAQGGRQHGVEQTREQAAERAAGWRAGGRFATIFHCGAGETRKMEGKESRLRRRDGQTKRPAPDTA